MIAKITFPLRGAEATATLSDGGVWSCADPVITDMLNALRAGASTSPSEGRLYWRHARRMAEVLRGSVEYGPAGDGPPGRVY